MVILKADGHAPVQIQQTAPSNFPVTKTDPERWRALKRDLGIGDDHTEDLVSWSPDAKFCFSLAKVTYEVAESTAMRLGCRLIRISDIQYMSNKEKIGLRAEWKGRTGGLWLGDAPDINEGRRKAIEAVLNPCFQTGLSKVYAHEGTGPLYVSESYWDNRMEDVIGVGCADKGEEHRFCAIKDV